MTWFISILENWSSEMDWLEKCRNWDILDFRLFNLSLTCDAMTRSSEGSRGSSNTHSKMRGSGETQLLPSETMVLFPSMMEQNGGTVIWVVPNNF